MRDPYRQVHLYVFLSVVIPAMAVALTFSTLRAAERSAVPNEMDDRADLRIRSRVVDPSVITESSFRVFAPDPNPLAIAGTGSDIEWRSRFKLVATVLGVNEAHLPETVAVLQEMGDDAAARHHIVRPGSRIGDAIQVRRILSHAAILDGPGGSVRLDLDFSYPHSSLQGVDDRSAVVHEASAVHDAFGGRLTGNHQWTFERNRLLEYYQELRNHPQRLLQIFDSLKPRYQADQTIQGYQLVPEGEAEFFQAAGLKPGDIIYAVNHVPMTNRRRAEHFIRRVVADGLDTIVLDVERNGERVRHQYLIAD